MTRHRIQDAFAESEADREVRDAQSGTGFSAL